MRYCAAVSRVVASYDLEAEVASGPLAKLWRGRLRASAGFTRPVAVRQLAAKLAKDPRFVGTWAAAASELATIAGPHVEQVLDFVVDGENVLIVTEWIEGLSLRRWRASSEEPIAWPLAALVGVDVLDALVRPHQRSPALLHGGLTSAAVRVAEDGTVKLMRFGAASALAAAGAGRRRMEGAGLWHAAPELAAGKAATAATDQHAVGALLFELLTGQAPFADGEALAAGEARDLSSLRADVPPLLVAHVERALRAEPRERFDSVLTMARALAQLLRSSPEPVDRATLARAVRDARSGAGGAPSAMVAGPAALAASLRSMTGGEPPAAARAEAERPTEAEGEPEAVEAAPDEEAPAEPAGAEPADEPPSEEQPAEEASAEGAAPEEAAPERPPSSGEQKLPQGLPSNRTMAVSVSELKEIVVGEPPSERSEPSEKKRYKFQPKDRSATRKVEEEKSAVLGIPVQESDAAPLPLTKSKKPVGLSPAKTEMLDDEQLDELTIGRKPAGLSPAKTEHLDESQVDRLTIGGAGNKKPKKSREPDATPKRPLGLQPQKTELLEEDEVDQLEIDE